MEEPEVKGRTFHTSDLGKRSLFLPDSYDWMNCQGRSEDGVGILIIFQIPWTHQTLCTPLNKGSFTFKAVV